LQKISANIHIFVGRLDCISTTIHDNPSMLEWRSISCPYCGENFKIPCDLSGGSQRYTEDCQVCCQPMDIRLTVYDMNIPDFSVEVEPENQ
jgi:transcription elongation factor Elf1